MRYQTTCAFATSLTTILLSLSSVTGAPYLLPAILGTEAIIAAGGVGYNAGKEQKYMRKEQKQDAQYEKARYVVDAQQKWYADRIALMQNAQSLKMRNYVNAQTSGYGNEAYNPDQSSGYDNGAYYPDQSSGYDNGAYPPNPPAPAPYNPNTVYPEQPTPPTQTYPEEPVPSSSPTTTTSKPAQDSQVTFFSSKSECASDPITTLSSSYLTSQSVPLRVSAGSIKMQNIKSGVSFSFFTDADTLISVKTKKDIGDITLCDLAHPINDDVISVSSLKTSGASGGNDEKPPVTKPESPKPKVHNQEQPKPEPPKQESPKPEAPKPEPPKPEVPKPEAPKQESPKPEPPKQESPKPPKQESHDNDDNGNATQYPTQHKQ